MLYADINGGLNVGKKKNGSILVLDDDFDMSNLLKISLMKQGYNALSFGAGAF